MKKLIALLINVMLFFAVFAQKLQRPEHEMLAWKILQDAQLYYEQGDLGEAIRIADAAKQQRKNEVEWSLSVLNQALAPTSIQKLGDNIDLIMNAFEERNAEDALSIMHNVMIKYPADTINNSVSELIKKLSLYIEYPEADYLLGKLYIFEGEYTVADKYLTNAWLNAGILDIPDQKFDILYQMANLAKLQKNDEKYEKSLLLIIADDNYIKPDGTDDIFIKAVKQYIARDDTTIDKLFTLYRSKAYTSLNAYYLLADYYASKGNSDKALSMSTLATLISFTRIYEAVAARDMEYKFEKPANARNKPNSAFLAYLETVGKYYDISEWGAKNGIWKGYFNYAKILHNAGRYELAEELFSCLSQYCPEDFWRNMALRELLSLF
ncbi:MAG: hypothetical protein J6V73_02475 [Spirochaetaceae bacterium]|nr:hypothetical protein [Spirochaetaceae bacterium]